MSETTEQPKYYLILGMSTNNIIESLSIQGYNINDIHYYLLENYSQLEDKYPFIAQILSNLVNLYKKQYKLEINLNNFMNLVKISDEFGSDFLRVIECNSETSINACSYYQNNRKTIGLKLNLGNLDNSKVPEFTTKGSKFPESVTLTVKDLQNSAPVTVTLNKPSTVTLKPKISIRTKK